MAVLFISAELEEVLRLSHKIAVLRDRRLVAELANDDLDADASCRPSPAEPSASGRAGMTTGRRPAPPVLAGRCPAALLLVATSSSRPGFFSIEIQDGHLYGSLIDILRFGAPLILVALGMTLVIATGGIDLSVGSRRRDHRRAACLHISELDDQNSVPGVLVAVGARARAVAGRSASGTASSSPASASSRSSPP